MGQGRRRPSQSPWPLAEPSGPPGPAWQPTPGAGSGPGSECHVPVTIALTSTYWHWQPGRQIRAALRFCVTARASGPARAGVRCGNCLRKAFCDSFCGFPEAAEDIRCNGCPIKTLSVSVGEAAARARASERNRISDLPRQSPRSDRAPIIMWHWPNLNADGGGPYSESA